MSTAHARASVPSLLANPEQSTLGNVSSFDLRLREPLLGVVHDLPQRVPLRLWGFALRNNYFAEM